MSIKLTVYRCQRCGFTFERRGEPQACPQCGRSYVLEVHPEEQESSQTNTESDKPEA